MNLKYFILLIILTGCSSSENIIKDDSWCHPNCNVILISIDTLRADHLGIYGYQRNTSPNIDVFAKNGIVFENFFSQETMTLPSHMSIMTSLYPSMHGVVTTHKKLPNSTRTIAEVLKDNGYVTAAFTGGYAMSKKYGFDQGFDIYKEEYDENRDNPRQGWRLKHLEKDLFSWLDEHSKKKFFLFIHTYDTHAPFIAHDYLREFEKNYSGKFDVLNNHSVFVDSKYYTRYSVLLNNSLNINDFYNEIINKKMINFSKADEEHIIALYDNEIRFVDEYFGRIIEKIKGLNLMENTVIILTSDHGEQLLERGEIRHGGKPYDEVIKVPLIINIPHHNNVTVRYKELAQSIDITPTILYILDIEPEDDFGGISLLPLKNVDNHFVISQRMVWSSLRTKNMKLFYNSKNHNLELYDLENDPGELDNIAESNPDIVKKLKKDLFDTLNIVDMDVESLEQLKALGYIN